MIFSLSISPFGVLYSLSNSYLIGNTFGKLTHLSSKFKDIRDTLPRNSSFKVLRQTSVLSQMTRLRVYGPTLPRNWLSGTQPLKNFSNSFYGLLVIIQFVLTSFFSTPSLPLLHNYLPNYASTGFTFLFLFLVGKELKLV